MRKLITKFIIHKMIKIRVDTNRIKLNKFTSSNLPSILVSENGSKTSCRNVKIIGDSRVVSSEDGTSVWIECEAIILYN